MQHSPNERAETADAASVPSEVEAERRRPAASSATVRPWTAGTGPARYFADHPLTYALSLAGSAGTALYALAAAARPNRRHRAIWLALGAHCAAQSVGIVAATELTRHRARADRRDQQRGYARR